MNDPDIAGIFKVFGDATVDARRWHSKQTAGAGRVGSKTARRKRNAIARQSRRRNRT